MATVLMRFQTAALVTLAALGLTAPAAAHHAFSAEFDSQNFPG